MTQAERAEILDAIMKLKTGYDAMKECTCNLLAMHFPSENMKDFFCKSTNSMTGIAFELGRLNYMLAEKEDE
jgi:hypothetical protein